jgi:undecaprenyl pyrophosphate phosphatase UppP
MDLLSTILLGVIEGITEFLPISSTGHLLIAEQWLGQRSETEWGNQTSDFAVYFLRLRIAGSSAPLPRI